jgi:pyrroloquinoline quinone (PQQ) biosynthesis protein C
MKFSQVLAERTQNDRAFLLDAPLIMAALQGQITRAQYLAFLTQAYHHVRHTVPLLMAVGARLEDRHPWLQRELIHYLEEEVGHEQWVLNDIAAAGGDPDAAGASQPNVETDAMVAYAWDTVNRRNPVGFFGMVHVLEGTSVAVALDAAARIQAALDLPDSALTYLTSHGRLDQEHVGHLQGILDRLSEPAEHAAVIDCARTMYWLYGHLFRGIDRGAAPAHDISLRVAS